MQSYDETGWSAPKRVCRGTEGTTSAVLACFAGVSSEPYFSSSSRHSHLTLSSSFTSRIDILHLRGIQHTFEALMQLSMERGNMV